MNKIIFNKTVFAVFMLFAASCLAASLAAADMNSGSDTAMVNINEASVDELAGLTGIGKTKAEAIIAYRSEHGRFESVEAIQNVKGIGTKIFESISNKITVR